jgi:L-lactate utilization protein LutC
MDVRNRMNRNLNEGAAAAAAAVMDEAVTAAASGLTRHSSLIQPSSADHPSLLSIVQQVTSHFIITMCYFASYQC